MAQKIHCFEINEKNKNFVFIENKYKTAIKNNNNNHWNKLLLVLKY